MQYFILGFLKRDHKQKVIKLSYKMSSDKLRFVEEDTFLF